MIDAISALRTPVANLVREACARFVLPRFRALADHHIESKSHPNDLVTVADIDAEAWLTPRLRALLPEALVLGEEAQARGEVELDLLRHGGPVWLVDPIDGTYNFAHGNPKFCCMIALVQDGQVLMGWIYFPTRQRLYWAGQGAGAHVEQDGAAPESLAYQPTSDLAAISRRLFQAGPLKPNKSSILKTLAPTRPTGCAGHDYCQAARGTLAYLAMAKLMPWDHAAGTLLVTEAGGQAHLNGGAYDPRLHEGILIAGGHRNRMREAVRCLYPRTYSQTPSK